MNFLLLSDQALYCGVLQMNCPRVMRAIWRLTQTGFLSPAASLQIKAQFSEAYLKLDSLDVTVKNTSLFENFWRRFGRY